MPLAKAPRALPLAAAPHAHPLWGHLPDFAGDPLRFLTACGRSESPALPLRFVHVPAVLLLDPAEIERVLVTEHGAFLKPLWLRTAAVRRLLGNGLVTSEGATWRSQRQACQPAFHLNRMNRYGQAMLSLVESTLQGWQSGQRRDLQHDMSCLTMEVIARTLLEVEVPGWTAEASEAMDTLMARFTRGAGFYGMIPLPPGLGEIRAERTLNRTVDALIRANLAHDATRSPETTVPNLLTQLRRPVSEGGEGLEGSALRDQVKTFLGAGYESSALTLTWAFLLLAQHPEVEEELVAELATVVGDRAPTPDDLPHLICTQAIVKETMRLFPPLWMTGRQAVRRCEIGGVPVPAGALVLTSQWVVQRLPRYFESPDRFRPDRWRNGETADLPRYAYFPFGGGPRICIGQSFAMMESGLLLAAIARRFRIVPPPELELRPWATMTLRPPTGIRVRLVDRERP